MAVVVIGVNALLSKSMSVVAPYVQWGWYGLSVAGYGSASVMNWFGQVQTKPLESIDDEHKNEILKNTDKIVDAAYELFFSSNCNQSSNQYIREALASDFTKEVFRSNSHREFFNRAGTRFLSRLFECNTRTAFAQALADFQTTYLDGSLVQDRKELFYRQKLVVAVLSLVNDQDVETGDIKEQNIRQDRTGRLRFQEFMSHPVAGFNRCKAKWYDFRANVAAITEATDGNEKRPVKEAFEEKSRVYNDKAHNIVKGWTEKRRKIVTGMKSSSDNFYEKRFNLEYMHANKHCYKPFVRRLLTTTEILRTTGQAILASDTNLGLAFGHWMKKGYEALWLRHGSYNASRAAGHAVGICIAGVALGAISFGLGAAGLVAWKVAGKYAIAPVSLAFICGTFNTLSYLIDFGTQGMTVALDRIGAPLFDKRSLVVRSGDPGDIIDTA
ncbi:MAG: hypothetical protein HC848_06040 [Limnobacter sp.]|nr:hypothetical protein [Limnobacter sp.]